MRVDPADLERLTLENFPDPFLKALLESAFVARRAALEMCRQNFADPETENVLGLNVRGKLEQLLRATAERHGLEATVLKEPGQPWYHTEVRGGPLVLTAATVRSPGGMVDPSDYRRGLAESNQLRFDLGEAADPPGDSPLYVLFTHSRSHWLPDAALKYAHLPGSAYLAYPTADLQSYVHVINLMDRYPDVVRKHVPQDWTEEAVLKYLVQTRRSAFGA